MASSSSLPSFNSSNYFSSPLKPRNIDLPLNRTHIIPQLKPPEPKLLITGANKLSGHVAISGSKNSSLSILAATLCCSGTSELRNVPNLADIRAMSAILRSLGAEIEVFNGGMLINTDFVQPIEPCKDEIEKLRGGFFVIGPLLARFGEAVVALPGGCHIGARPIDLYIRGLCALGANVHLRDGKVKAYAANGKGLVGGRFHLDYPSVGATETLMMAACMADGVSVLSNVAQEPEVVDLANFLANCGAIVEGAGTNKLYIKGCVKLLHGSEYDIIPDRIEAGTYMLVAAITRSCISMSPVFSSHLSCLKHKLLGAGCKIMQQSCDILQISALPEDIGYDLKGFDFKTSPYPGFPTDLQPQTMALLTTCIGTSNVEESVFENRMGHVKELQKLGRKIQVCGSTAVVFGREKVSGSCTSYGCRVSASDLRGGASLVLAGLAVDGITEISGVSHIDRGYENLEIKLQRLGASVSRSFPNANT